MTNTPDQDNLQVLLTERLKLVSQLTELNARHIKAETVRSGLEIEMASVETNSASNDSASTIPSELGKLKDQHEEQLQLQQSIDTERDKVTRRLDQIAEKLSAVY